MPSNAIKNIHKWVTHSAGARQRNDHPDPDSLAVDGTSSISSVAPVISRPARWTMRLSLWDAMLRAILCTIEAANYAPDILLGVDAADIADHLFDGSLFRTETLEFVGDKALWLYVVLLILRMYPHLWAHPDLVNQLSSALTSNLVFNSIMKRLSLWPGNTGDKQAADLFEAYTGQVDHIYGISFTQRLFAPMLEPLIRAAYRAMESHFRDIECSPELLTLPNSNGPHSPTIVTFAMSDERCPLADLKELGIEDPMTAVPSVVHPVQFGASAAAVASGQRPGLVLENAVTVASRLLRQRFRAMDRGALTFFALSPQTLPELSGHRSNREAIGRHIVGHALARALLTWAPHIGAFIATKLVAMLVHPDVRAAMYHALGWDSFGMTTNSLYYVAAHAHTLHGLDVVEPAVADLYRPFIDEVLAILYPPASRCLTVVDISKGQAHFLRAMALYAVGDTFSLEITSAQRQLENPRAILKVLGRGDVGDIVYPDGRSVLHRHMET